MGSQGKKVYVGMSGGVDSSVSAALLKEQGFDVTGVFIKVWNPDWMECSSQEDRLDAMRVAAKLDIPFITIDFSEEYKREVVDYMINEYKIGRTPNPDVMCNRYVKFGAFFNWAVSQGADFVATGHYAQTTDGKLYAGLDQGKDQSYFLWTLTERELSKTFFPVGGFKKNETRKLAKKFGLPTATKKDSQGLCFIGKVDIKEFLSHYIENKIGNVLDEAGNIIGEHRGAVFFTLGERHGFNVTKKSPDDLPYFITAKDIQKNTLTVSHKETDGTLLIERTSVRIDRTNWIPKPPEDGIQYLARIRHLGELLPCKIESNKEKFTVIFEKPLIVAPGQSMVIYKDEVCLGGGIVV